jgi:hypothetical protein
MHEGSAISLIALDIAGCEIESCCAAFAMLPVCTAA